MPTPLLILSDAPTAKTGLGRICRDLATRIHKHLPDVFEVGTCGYGGPHSKALGFPQYPIDMRDWVVENLPEIWSDFSGDRKGILFTIWDASRMQWLARPETCPDRKLRTFLTNIPFKRYGYFPMDATGINDRLTLTLKHTIDGYERVLAYSKWAEDILRQTLNNVAGLENLPHGIDTSVFYPRPRIQARHGFGQRLGARHVQGKKQGQFISIPDDALMVGIVGTNQPRKDWGLGLSALAELGRERKVIGWLHTDVVDRHWSISNLIYDLELRDKVIVTTNEPTDEQMAWAYSACDVTLGIGLGEGFGFPIFESLACGVPCIHGNYGGAAEHLPEYMLIDPPGYPEITPMRIEGQFNCLRPVYNAKQVAFAVKFALQEVKKEPCTLPAHLDWNNLWPRWAEWFTKGIK